MIWLAVTGPGFNLLALPDYRRVPNEGALLRIDRRTGAVTRVADLGAYEVANNPDGIAVDTNLWGLALGADGRMRQKWDVGHWRRASRAA